jgi:hypothetical protein
VLHRPIFRPCHLEFLAYWTRICHPIAADDFALQPLSDSEHWELECSKDPDWPDFNPRLITQEIQQLWTEGSLFQFMPQPTFTSSSDTESYISTAAKPQWRLYPNPSSAELCSRKGESSEYGRSSEHPNHDAWYISRQFHSVLVIPCILFFSAP